MKSEIRKKAVELAAGYYANWKSLEIEQKYAEAANCRNRYEGALRMAILLGVDNGDGENRLEDEIKDIAYKLYGDEIGKGYEDHATW